MGGGTGLVGGSPSGGLGGSLGGFGSVCGMFGGTTPVIRKPV